MTSTTGRLGAWWYALRTLNPPPGEIDAVTRWLVVTRAAVLPMTLVAGLVAGLLAVGEPGFDAALLALSVLGILLAHLGNNLVNDLFDHTSGSDAAATYPRLLYAPHPIAAGLVTRRALLTSILIVHLAALAVLVVLAAARGWVVVAFAVAGLVLSVAYTAPPLRLKKHGLGEPDVLVVWGPLMVGGTYYAAVGALPWQVLPASLPTALLSTAVLMGKHIDKIPYDEPLGLRTLPVILGERRARRLTQAMMAGCYLLTALCVLVGALPWPALLVLAALPRLVTCWRYFGRPRPDEPPAGFPVWPLWFAAIAFVHARLAGAALVGGLVVAVMLDAL